MFDSDLRELSRSGERVALTPKAYALLEALIDSRPQPLSREALVRILWPDTIVEPGNLHNLVSEARGALGDDDHRIIRTVHRFGYAFDAAGAVEETPRFVLVVGQEEIPLRAGENIIGRDPADTVMIDVAEVSRHHARMTVTGSEVTLEDLGSKNGTFVGRTRVKGAVHVEPGDEIVIGTVRVGLRSARAAPSTRTAQ